MQINQFLPVTRTGKLSIIYYRNEYYSRCRKSVKKSAKLNAWNSRQKKINIGDLAASLCRAAASVSAGQHQAGSNDGSTLLNNSKVIKPACWPTSCPRACPPHGRRSWREEWTPDEPFPMDCQISTNHQALLTSGNHNQKTRKSV